LLEHSRSRPYRTHGAGGFRSPPVPVTDRDARVREALAAEIGSFVRSGLELQTKRDASLFDRGSARYGAIDPDAFARSTGKNGGACIVR